MGDNQCNFTELSLKLNIGNTYRFALSEVRHTEVVGNPEVKIVLIPDLIRPEHGTIEHPVVIKYSIQICVAIKVSNAGQ